MSRAGLLVCLGVVSVALAGCQPQPPSADTSNTSASTAPASPARPSPNADENAWGVYLAAQGKLHGKDIAMRPYIYVIPTGDSSAANARRQNETDSVIHSIGPILIPGSMLILGGPNAKQTTAFITDLSMKLKANAMKDIVVMVVSDASEQSTVDRVLKASGATVRFVTM